LFNGYYNYKNTSPPCIAVAAQQEQRHKSKRCSRRQCPAAYSKTHSTKACGTWMGSFASPADSPDFAPSDYKAFRSLQNWLNGKEFTTEAELRQSIQDWIDSRSAGFWVMGFVDLPERWAKAIEYEGDYFPDE
uniref:Uncharacterized protein n=1 Tax=Acrobeloides nanus TaxID=290746 RepID=A0A914CZH3_9BILA